MSEQLTPPTNSLATMAIDGLVLALVWLPQYVFLSPTLSSCVSVVLMCSLNGCGIGEGGARAFGAVVPKDRQFTLELSRCVLACGVWCVHG